MKQYRWKNKNKKEKKQANLMTRRAVEKDK